MKVVIWRQLEPSAAMVTLWWPVLLMVEIKPLEKTTELPLVTEKFFTKSCIKYNLNSITNSSESGVVEVMIASLLDWQLHMQSVPIANKVVSLNSTHGEVYTIQHYVIKFVSDMRKVFGFFLVLRFSPPIKLTTTIWLKYC